MFIDRLTESNSVPPTATTTTVIPPMNSGKEAIVAKVSILLQRLLLLASPLPYALKSHSLHDCLLVLRIMIID